MLPGRIQIQMHLGNLADGPAYQLNGAQQVVALLDAPVIAALENTENLIIPVSA
ncbi:hypothetical protein D3C81_2223950 [compost metagenome]